MNLRKEVGIAIKSKETSSYLKLVRNSYVAIMHQPVTVSSNIQPNAGVAYHNDCSCNMTCLSIESGVT